MSYRLSLLDKSPIGKGETAYTALRRTIAYAQQAEALGYTRFWVAEHHNTAELASSSPEILIAALATATSTIRLGSGGVMLQHYSPYKIAENFNLLESLAPGRIDVGIGKAPGGLPLSTRALQAGRDPDRHPDFAQQLREFDAYLGAGSAERVEGLAATPAPHTQSERFLLGASVESAQLAAELGWQFVFARHLNGDDVVLASAISTYRNLVHRTPIVALAAIVDPDGGKARETASGFTPFRVTIPGGQSVTVGSEAQAAEYARQAGAVDYTIEKRKANVLAGDGHDIIAATDRLARQFGIEEFILDLFNPGDSRLVAIGLIASARDAAAAPQALSA
ncbi:MsnO8 family LLM class oxidoreductase [Devosia rhizoryzae]|uniref:MsnO8 family LLM class oxidoreductase n=1 Tax=Devosia rhizoryzae TaxID=2774137 RepID=A0ABX7C6Y5_9HYPH|nr:MsnO8 family LLM class oxidoreductase [Devosia rhizoryzae]QQR38487.1 MsnO8 family LLM class oxidoreductase [Devosia rhizoryzae]